ncbi:Uncharacterised protein [Pragia fontium]|uniref:hypothetical protein n=1 Tax=Pragia fontium TaxID=82985 RepID=UPI00064A5E5D|nr:hypothetical protein [Pragia fontium]AKJ42318.1 hypothetical protein QQ39_09670 [Pragia fontium]SUB82602.1 Uncharacterised protein [Pragia fontium]
MKKIVPFLVVSLAGYVGSVTSVFATGSESAALKPVISLSELFAEKSSIWQTYPDNDNYVFDRSQENYVIAAKRADGVVALVNKQESYMTPGKMVLMGTYFQCGKMIDASFSVENAEELAQEFAAPAIDNSERLRGFDESMPVHDLYLVACSKN